MDEKEQQIRVGDVVRSKNGRFAGENFVILRLDGEMAFVANGRSRKSDHPKMKKLKHLELGIGHSNHIEEKLLAGEKITNNELRITIEKYDAPLGQDMEGKNG